MVIESFAPIFAMATSLGGGLLLGVTGARPRLRDFAALAIAGAQLIVLVTMLPSVLGGASLEYTLFTFLPEVAVAFRVDALGLMFALTASALWLVTTAYSIGYLGELRSPGQTRFHLYFALTMTSTMGVAFSANLATLYLFYEAMTLATYFLVVHDGTEEAYAGGRKYVAYHLGTSIAFLLPAIILTFHLSGTFAFSPGGVFSDGALAGSRVLLTAIFCLFLAGSAKVALMPLHGWLPSAMVAPVPVSALLHAVAVVNAGAFGVLRIMLEIFGPEAMQSLGLATGTIYLASFTIIAASVYALRLDSLKALLAFSTISQLAYIVLGGALLNGAGVTGGVIHIVNHGVSKMTLFLCAGAIYVATRKKYLSEMHGLGRRMPWTMAAFAIGAFSMVGFPITAGFISKWFLFVGAYQAGQLVAIVVLAISTLLSAAYYLRAIGILGGIRLLGAETSAGHSKGSVAAPPLASYGDGSAWIVIPLIVTASLTILLGLFPEDLALELARQVAGAASK